MNMVEDKYKYGSCGFGSCSEFSLPDGTMGKNVFIFGADMLSSVYIDNKRKYILILGDRPTKALGDDIDSRSKISY